MFSWLTKKIKSYIIKKASRHRAVDIVEVRTKEIGLLSVKTETVLKLLNSFFLPITLLSITTDLLNRDGIKVGKMVYTNPVKLKARSSTTVITQSEISSITSLFQALTNLLAQPIYMRSLGTASLKFLWWTVEIEVDDVFEIHPSKLKIRKEESEEKRTARLKREEERKAQLDVIREERRKRSADKKEEKLKRRHKENYITKEEREHLETTRKNANTITIERNDENNHEEIPLNESVVSSDVEQQDRTENSLTENQITNENQET